MLPRISQLGAKALSSMLLVIGCGGGSDEGAAESPGEVQAADEALALCDASDAVRFAAARESNRPYAEYYIAWGFRFDWFVIIDGACRFWVGGAPGITAVHTGTLDDATAESLAQDLMLDMWTELMSVPGTADQGIILLSNGTEQLTCSFESCSSSTVDELVSVAVDLPINLGAQSEVLTDVGVLSVRALPEETDGVPLTVPEELESVIGEAYPTAVENGDYRLIEVSDPELLSWLRQQREDFVSTSFGNPDFDLQITADGNRYGLAFRDKTPHEDILGGFAVFQ